MRARARRCAAAGVALFVAAIPRSAPAQALAPVADTLSGRVLAADSTPVPQAHVHVTAGDGRQRAAATDSAGRYLLVIPAGSGSYAVQASAFGYISFTATVQPREGSRRIHRDFRLSARPVVLEAIRVSAPPRSAPDRGTPAERAGRWDSFLTHQQPLDPGDFADIGSLVPGIVRSGEGLSIAGQAPGQNGATVDGATFGGGSLPSEGVRSVHVLGTTYDVSRGQFSGGQVAASTIGGTNLWGGAVTARLDDAHLSYGGSPAGLAASRGQLLRISAGGGGAFVRDRLFVYGAFDITRTRYELLALDLLDATAFRQLGLAPDSAARLVEIARRLGLATEGALPPGTSDGLRGLARVDWVPPKLGTVTARLDWRGFESAGLGASPLRLAGGGGDVRSRDGGLLLQHAGSWGRAANTLRFYGSAGRSGADDASLPSGVVRVSSRLDDGSDGISFLSLGDLAGIPGENRRLWEIADDLKVAVPGHQVRAGFVVQEQGAWRERFSTLGTFTFNSLDDLERGSPSSFVRVLGAQPARAVRRHAALYLGDAWRPREWLSVIGGVRVEASRYAARPSLLPALEALPGTSAGVNVPSDLVVTPRVGFSYSPRNHPWSFEGGLGGFAGVPPLGQLAARWGQTGAGDVVLSCIGAAAPDAEWAGYAADPGSIPTSCADGSLGFAATAPSAMLFGRGYRGARTWRATLSAQRSLTPLWGLRLDALVAHGTRLPTAIDRNLHASPAFALAGEGRPVYAAPAYIDPVSGGIAPGAGRILSGFGAVDEIGSAGRSWTMQLGAGAGGIVRRMRMAFQYTYTHARTRFGGIDAPGSGEATTAGDPARLEWMDASFTPRHHLFANLTAPLFRRVRLSAIGTLSSGLPFTPMVGADVNGDGRANDRAFIFGPDDALDAGVAAGMRRLMEEGPAGVRGCLRAGVGGIAAPGACRTPWSPSLDLRAEVTPFGALNARRFVLAIDARNVTAGVDYLLHEPHRLRGWGQPASVDPTLLEVRGFDPAGRAFLYDVNPRFGRPSSGGQQRLPFRLVVEGRFTVGADPRYQPLMRAIELNSGQSRESILAQLSGRLRNVPAAILQLDATDTTALALSPAQRAFLRAAADSLAPHFAAAVDSLATAFTSRASPVVAAARLQELGVRAAGLQEAAIRRARAVLTGDQWTRVPAWLTRPAGPDELLRSPRFQVTIDG